MALQRKLGNWGDVSIEVAAWDGVTAPVDLSCVCMFEYETGTGQWAGGLRHLDVALGGRLSDARRSTAFRGNYLETWLLDHPAPEVRAAAVLVVGLGDPGAWTPSVSAMAAATAFRTAIHRDAESCAFAPSILDAGFDSSSVSGVAQAMMLAVMDAITEQAMLMGASPVSYRLPKRWIFDVGTAHFDEAAEQFQAVLSSRTPPPQ